MEKINQYERNRRKNIGMVLGINPGGCETSEKKR
jgi:hypothetical protein